MSGDEPDPPPRRARPNRAAPGTDDAIESMRVALARGLARERGLAGWLRSRPTTVRVGFALAASMLVIVALPMASPRDDLDSVDLVRAALLLGLTAVLLLASVWFGSRPLYRASVSPWVERGVVALALAGLVGLAFVPLAAPMPDDPVDWGTALICMYWGASFSLPAFVLIRLLDPGGRRGSAYLAAAASGLAANAGLAMFCPINSTEHVLKGHAIMGFLYVAAIVVWRWAMDALFAPREGEPV